MLYARHAGTPTVLPAQQRVQQQSWPGSWCWAKPATAWHSFGPWATLQVRGGARVRVQLVSGCVSTELNPNPGVDLSYQWHAYFLFGPWDTLYGRQHTAGAVLTGAIRPSVDHVHTRQATSETFLRQKFEWHTGKIAGFDVWGTVNHWMLHSQHIRIAGILRVTIASSLCRQGLQVFLL